MQIKNILVNNKDEYMDILLKELSVNNVAYVFIKSDENNLFDELHYNNRIIRFFDKNSAIKYIGENFDIDMVKINYNEPIKKDFFGSKKNDIYKEKAKTLKPNIKRIIRY